MALPEEQEVTCALWCEPPTIKEGCRCVTVDGEDATEVIDLAVEAEAEAEAVADEAVADEAVADETVVAEDGSDDVKAEEEVYET